MINGKPSVPPPLSDALDFHRRAGDAKFRVEIPGIIDSFDAVRRVATVLPAYNRVYNDGTVVHMPLIPDLPVQTIQGGGVHAAFPIKRGDECTVVFSDIDLDAWFKAGGQQTPLTAGRHKIASGFVLVGPNSLANPFVTALLPTEGGIATETAKVAIDNVTGLIAISTGPLPTQDLGAIFQTFFAALASATDPAVKAAAAAAAAQLLLVLK